MSQRLLTRLAVSAPVRVFVLRGTHSPGIIDELRLCDDVRVVETPRSALVLLVAGELPPSLHEAARRAHDAMSHPRAVVWWAMNASCVDAKLFPGATVFVNPPQNGSLSTPAIRQLAQALRGVQSALVQRERASTPPLLPDVDPAPWRGIGPYGQGGTGMTGGVPYGRPMAGRAPDRDGLELDQLPLRIGPFFDPFPAGLVLDIKLQGDVVQEAIVPGNAFAGHEAADHHYASSSRSSPDPFRAALEHPLPITQLERARAQHHLRWLAHALRVHGLRALGRRALDLAAMLERDSPQRVAAAVASLGRLLECSRTLGWATADVGMIAIPRVSGHDLGPVARAAGLPEDARQDDPAYRALGFEPIVQARSTTSHDAASDACDRWRQRLAETRQSLEIAARAGEARSGGPDITIEGPCGSLRGGASGASPTGTLLQLLPELLAGQEWGDAVTTIVSLDLDLQEAARESAPLAPPRVSQGTPAMAGMNRTMSEKANDHAHAGHGQPMH